MAETIQGVKSFRWVFSNSNSEELLENFEDFTRPQQV
jgi:hypothetical protein